MINNKLLLILIVIFSSKEIFMYDAERIIVVGLICVYTLFLVYVPSKQGFFNSSDYDFIFNTRKSIEKNILVSNEISSKSKNYYLGRIFLKDFNFTVKNIKENSKLVVDQNTMWFFVKKMYNL